MALTSINAAWAKVRDGIPLLKVGGTMEAAGTPHSLFYSAGYPGAASVPTPGINGRSCGSSVTGRVLLPDAPSGSNTYLLGMTGTASQAGTLMLIDRLWDNSGISITTTTAQAISAVSLPSRCTPSTDAIDGSPDALGHRIMMALEFSAASTNAAISNTTATYTGSDGTGSRTATLPTTPASIAAGSFLPFTLASGDYGVRAPSALTLGTSYLTGTAHLVLYRVIMMASVSVAGGPMVSAPFDPTKGNWGRARIYDGSCLQLVWLPVSTTAVNINASLVYAQG